MRPYGREKNIKGGKPWKTDVHPGKGFVNWWENAFNNIVSRSSLKNMWKKILEI